jgi:hypothetical protein
VNRYHYSSRPITALYSVKQRDEPRCKPRGLWYAADDSWKLSSEFWNDADAFDHRYHVVVASAARILRIESQEEAEALAKRIGVFNSVDQSFTRMRWIELADDYDGMHLGIQHSYNDWRSIAQWHHAFDVIGGCIWNTDVVTLIDCKTGAIVPRGGVDPREMVKSMKLTRSESWFWRVGPEGTVGT